MTQNIENQIYNLPTDELKRQRDIAQAYIDTNGRPHSVWEVGVEWLIDPDFDKSFDTWLASYKEKHYQLAIMED